MVTKVDRSDDLILVAEVSATDAARSFSDLLDAVEHHGERFTIVRRGTAVAQLEPIGAGTGRDVKQLPRRHRPDTSWAAHLDEVRRLVELDDRS